MNRIILIGNGFDLAHKMETKYEHFISSYWEKTICDIRSKAGDAEFKNKEIHIVKVPSRWSAENTFESLKTNLKRNKSKLIFLNKFLEIVTNRVRLKNWVDVENEYYKLLKELAINAPSRQYDDVSKLNSDFEDIKLLLEKYLITIKNKFDKEFSNPRLEKNFNTKIYSDFILKDFTQNVINELAKSELKKITQASFGGSTDFDPYPTTSVNDVKKLLLSENTSKLFDLTPNQVILLSFNYTSTPYLYHRPHDYFDFKTGSQKDILTEVINIHGQLEKPDNPVIFGFGDEIDQDYRKIEDLNNNDYLNYIKSIRYLEADNYRRLMQILDDDIFQIFIFGHSCGISDRTLLNTLFEHPNCGSIKPFYYKSIKNNVEIDNFSDIIRNISRNFNYKYKMRERVVNKKYCQPLVE